MDKTNLARNIGMGLLAILAAVAWQLLPNRYMGPYGAWNPHAILVFVLAVFSISLLGNVFTRWLGPRYGLLLTGVVGGFASSTATIHTMGTYAKAHPALADRAILGGVLSHLATLLQLAVLMQLLAPQLLALYVRPLCFGVATLLIYVAGMLFFRAKTTHPVIAARTPQAFNWTSLVTLTAIVCTASFAAAALNEAFGQKGLMLGAALSGLADAHASVPIVATLLQQGKLLPHTAFIAVLIALSVNTFVKCLLGLQSGGWVFAKKIFWGMCLTTAAVWLGYFGFDGALGLLSMFGFTSNFK